ncbi:hypothetical protein DAT35_09345 [Vitiosangium sp. GDMCC 1.1324]|nr:hypothetical protein DAT35_09345 [Vitiosangium sp. GDMCC 1.1324]
MLERLTLGGGGGSGHGKLDNAPTHSNGGTGGGIIFIRANNLSLSHTSALDASGAVGEHGGNKVSTPGPADAGGGGGAGGTILLRLSGTLDCNNQATPIFAKGGGGGDIDSSSASPRPGGGGGGGGGRLLYQANAITQCANLAVPAAGAGLALGGDGDPGILSASVGSTYAFTELTAVPTVSSPTGTISNRTPVISGTAPTGKQVVIYLNGVEVGRTYAASSSFSFQVTQSLADATYKATAAITEQGVYSKQSPPMTFTVDKTAPVPPVLKTLGKRSRVASDGMMIGGQLDLTSNTLAITGIAEPGSRVTVSQSGCSTTSNTATADASTGNWNLNLTEPTSTEATCSLEVTAEDTATPRNMSQKTTLSFSLDTKAPSAPSGITVAGQATTSSVLINTRWPMFAGNADTGNEVELTLSWTDASSTSQSRVFKTTASGSPGAWSIAAPEALGDFAYTLAAKARDPAGNETSIGTNPTFTVDTQAPAKPEIKTLGTPARTATAGMLIGPPDLKTGSLLTVSGKAVAGTTVKVVQAGSSSSPQTTTANGTGDWSVDLAQPLDTATEYTLQVTAEDAAHNVSEPGILGFKLDTKKPMAPFVTTVANQTPVGPTSTCTATSLPYVTTGLPLIQGTGEARGRIEVTLTAASTYNLPPTVVSGLPESSGSWSVSPTSTISDANVYTLSVTVTDEAGNKSLASTYCFAVDASPPGKPTAITFGSTLAVNGMRIGRAGMTAVSDTDPAHPTGTLSISGSAETNSTMSLKLIPLSAAVSMPPEQTPGAPSGSWSSSWPGLPSGSYALEARAKDAVGNLGPPETIFFELDLIRPTVTITGRPNNGSITTSKDAFFGFEPSKKVVSYRCNINGVAQTPCDNPLFYTVTEETGAYTLEVWATDLAGNETLVTAPAQWTWRVDSNQPTVLILNVGSVGGIPASGSATNSTAIEFRLQANKPGLRIDCKRDADAWEQPCQCNELITDAAGDICVRRYAGLADNTHILLAKAYSAETGAETPEYAWRKYEWEVDTKEPNTFVTSQPDAWKSVNFVRVDYTTPTEARKATFQCDLNGEVFPCPSPMVKSDLPDGPYTLRITATDAAGNVEEEPAEVSWTVDTTAPEAPVVQLPTQGARYKDLALRGTAAGERLSTISVYLDDHEKTPIGTVVVTDNDNGDWQLIIEAAQKPPDGPHFIRVRTTDRAGNTGVMSEPVQFIMDNEPPAVQIEGPDKNSASNSAAFRFTANEEGVTFQCKLDLNDLTDCGAEVSFSNLEEGPHTLNVYAVDSAGNKRETSYSWSVYLGRDIRAEGGGLGCSATSAAPSMLWLLGLLGLLLASQHRGSRQ